MNNSSSQFLKSIWLVGGVLCLLVFIYQATPILLNNLPREIAQGLGIFLIFFSLALLSAWSVFFFTKTFEKLKDRRLFYRTREGQRRQELTRISVEINGQTILLEASSKEEANELSKRFQDLHPAVEERNS